MLNIVIPMAGLGSRFVEAGYSNPKPLILVHNIPMIRLVIENLRPKKSEHRFIFIVQREHVKQYGLSQLLNEWAGSQTEIIQLDGLTEGAACTVLYSKIFIDSNSPLMIANCDQFINIDIDLYLQDMLDRGLDGQIMTMYADDPKWSFIDYNDNYLVSRVAEKLVISNEATVGVYNFAHGTDFIQAAEEMIQDNDRVNGEFYVAPTYNRLIRKNKRIGFFNVGSDLVDQKRGMFGLGTPSDLDIFHDDCRTAQYVHKLFFGK